MTRRANTAVRAPGIRRPQTRRQHHRYHEPPTRRPIELDRHLLQAVADTVPTDAPWCRAIQTGDALVAMQRLVTEAITANAISVDAEALSSQIQLYRSAIQIGISQTARTLRR